MALAEVENQHFKEKLVFVPSYSVGHQVGENLAKATGIMDQPEGDDGCRLCTRTGSAGFGQRRNSLDRYARELPDH